MGLAAHAGIGRAVGARCVESDGYSVTSTVGGDGATPVG